MEFLNNNYKRVSKNELPSDMNRAEGIIFIRKDALSSWNLLDI